MGAGCLESGKGRAGRAGGEAQLPGSVPICQGGQVLLGQPSRPAQLRGVEVQDQVPVLMRRGSCGSVGSPGRLGWDQGGGTMPPRRRRHKPAISAPAQPVLELVQWHRLTLAVSWAGWERQRAGRAGSPQSPSSGTVHTHAHAHTRLTLACTIPPRLLHREGWVLPP